MSYEDRLYAVPFYGESSFLMYRKDLFEQAGLDDARAPTWDQVAEYAGQAQGSKPGPGGDLSARQAGLG